MYKTRMKKTFNNFINNGNKYIYIYTIIYIYR